MYYWVKSSPVGGVRHPNRPVDPPASQPHTLNDVPGGGPNVTVIHPDRTPFDAATTKFNRYNDHDISLVNHLTGVLAAERGVDHVFTFDGDFRTLGFTVVPRRHRNAVGVATPVPAVHTRTRRRRHRCRSGWAVVWTRR